MAIRNGNMEKKTDQELMKLVVERNSKALKVLYIRYELAIFNFILRYVGQRELAQDLLQETFTRIWFAAHSFNLEKGYFKGWLFKIALNITRSEMSKKQYDFSYYDVTEINSSDENLVQSYQDRPDNKLEHIDLQDKIQSALSGLQPFLREIIILKHYQQLKFKEIAQITNTPEGTLKSRFHRAIALLKQHLTEMENWNETSE
jgi:RNA polymerase sigma-70 factor (ECF subfamily)